MPSKKGFGKSKKAGTKEKGQAARRDATRAAAIAEAEQAPEEPVEEPSPPEPGVQASPATEPAYEPSRGEKDCYRRMTIVHKYQQLDCPPESEWGKHGGTLRQIADFLDSFLPCITQIWALFRRNPLYGFRGGSLRGAARPLPAALRRSSVDGRSARANRTRARARRLERVKCRRSELTNSTS